VYIIDKHTDFYDYYSNIYGVDKSVVYDRRGSTPIDLNRYTDIQKYHPIHILLEVGDIQYIFLINRTIIKDVAIDDTLKLVQTFQEHKHYFDSPVSLHQVEFSYWWALFSQLSFRYDYSRYSNIKKVFNSVSNPILANTRLTKCLNAEKVWIDIQNYLTGLKNDKTVDNLNDVEKAEVHGFDKKSFRNMK